jgi:hypothetical protein
MVPSLSVTDVKNLIVSKPPAYVVRSQNMDIITGPTPQGRLETHAGWIVGRWENADEVKAQSSDVIMQPALNVIVAGRK